MKNIHEIYMKLAIDLAKNGIGKTSPNPLVGAVIVKPLQKVQQCMLILNLVVTTENNLLVQQKSSIQVFLMWLLAHLIQTLR